MRSILGLAAALVLLGASMPATTLAASPTRHTTSQSGVLCDFESALGDILVNVQDYDGQTFGDVVMWAPDAGPDDAPLISASSGTVTLTSSAVTADLELATIPTDEHPDAEVVGRARLTGTFAAAGDPYDFGSRVIRDGNRRYDLEVTSQLWSVDGTLSIEMLDGRSATQSLETCGAGIITQTTFGTNPNAYITATDQLFVSCTWETARGSAQLLAVVDDYHFLTQLVVVDGDDVAIGFASPELTTTAFAASYELFDPFGGTGGGTAAAEAALTASGERITDVRTEEPYRFSVIGERLSVAGTLSVTLDGVAMQLAMDDASCEAGDVFVQVMERMPRS